MGKLFIMLGLFLLAIGILLQWAPQLLSWFGRLPGDIDIQTEHTRIFIPITSMIVVSIVLSLILNIFLRR
ncbi:Protein of unknown function [Sulfurivirga caldicuralii]|uniref:DUF2905 domain-containing protein n=1 Tax=Sulfurivirga caldicuralii TaxID=364032 RepID=A0A1N6DEE8_9GAMM|nr:DUF2905 domain-containing protein [Sulfurivirga caldicuralii]SIN69043.1 Protein of unknown function [Sulfurivirga caldicuralii]